MPKEKKLNTRVTLILDNSSIHKGEQIAKKLASMDLNLMFLPPYYPKFNPVELEFTRLKHKVRTISPQVY